MSNEEAVRMAIGRVFQRVGAADEKALLPQEVCILGVTRRHLFDDLRLR